MAPRKAVLDGTGGSYCKILLDAFPVPHLAILVHRVPGPLFLYLLQIVIGSSATALSLWTVPTAAVTVLTAVGTVVAGLLARMLQEPVVSPIVCVNYTVTCGELVIR
jgi:hypothetical protein